ncbi:MULTISPECIES: EthD family reductase [Pandoraea]|uniref:Ethyl tert-butyl ether degradation protein EthD n=1 Tax=Pandoraea communis TaxID=2508297 RepID=A0A5E4XUC1_9BURK|nr:MULTISPECIES: EthD family reductase [Pandoraea]ALS66637.1 hypothetical protein AT395_18075 [Pandoraea apista]CFB61380.1 EthD protein [Pandoraea apista]VVE39930.1 hypothetical protein PCO31110_04149 [Pandoraea communis]
MSLCVFLTATTRNGGAEHDNTASAASIHDLLDLVPGLQKLAIHLPVTAKADDPFIPAEDAPACSLQLHFGGIDTLESALTKGGALHSLLDPHSFPSFANCDWALQAMLTRRFPVDEPSQTCSYGIEKCTYLVSYEGPAENENAWHDHYIRNHPPLMAQLPGVREIEIYTRIDYLSSLPVERANHMQRNKTVFDSHHALRQALASPIRQRLRDDFLSLPTFSGRSPHYPMQTLEYSIS